MSFASVLLFTITLNTAVVDTPKFLAGHPPVWSDAAELAFDTTSKAAGYPFELTRSAPILTRTVAADVRRGQVPWPVNSQQLIPWRLPK